VVLSANAKLGMNAATACIGLLLTFSHSHNVVVIGYIVLAFSLVVLLYVQLTVNGKIYPNMNALQSHRLRLAFGILVVGLILQFSGAAFHLSRMELIGSSTALIGFVAVLCMKVAAKVGNHRAPHQPE
jgi:hypothetical protein